VEDGQAFGHLALGDQAQPGQDHGVALATLGAQGEHARALGHAEQAARDHEIDERAGRVGGARVPPSVGRIRHRLDPLDRHQRTRSETVSLAKIGIMFTRLHPSAKLGTVER